MAELLYAEKLYRAISQEKTQEVKRLLGEKGNVNSLRTSNPIMRVIDFENIYPIEKACKTSFEMAQLLLDAGADASVVDPYMSSTPLILALTENYEERFELAFRLIAAGAKIDQVDDNGRSALNRAAVIFSTDGVEARAKEFELMKYLLEACDIERVMSVSGRNPLVEAARFDNITVMKYILDGKLVDINRMSMGFTALMKAVLANCKEACRLLLEYGADTSLLSPSGKTAADYAVKRGDPEILRMFS